MKKVLLLIVLTITLMVTLVVTKTVDYKISFSNNEKNIIPTTHLTVFGKIPVKYSYTYTWKKG